MQKKDSLKLIDAMWQMQSLVFPLPLKLAFCRIGHFTCWCAWCEQQNTKPT